MTEIEYRLSDLINFSSNQKPIEFENALSNILSAKVAVAIADKKLEMSQTMFRSTEEDLDTEEEEYND